MGVPHLKFKTRPKKKGARKNRRILEQKKRLIAAGLDKESVNKMTVREIRDNLKEVVRKKKSKRKG